MVPNNALTRGLVLLGTLALMVGSAVAQAPSPALLIASAGNTPSEDVLLIVDPLAKKVVSRVPIGSPPHNVTVSPDGKFAFTGTIRPGTQWLNYPWVPKKAGDPELLPSDTLAVIDLTTQKVLRFVDVGPGCEPHGVAFGGGRVFFTCEGFKLVGRYDPINNRIDWMGGMGQDRMHEIVVTKDGREIFTADMGGADTVAALVPWDPAVDVRKNLRASWSGTVIPVGRGSEGIGMSPDEKEIWILNRTDGSASIIDVATKKVVQTLDLKTKDPLRVTFTPDGSRALISDAQSGEILVLDRAARREIKRIPDVGKQIHGIVVAPDGALAYAAVQGSGNVAIIDMKTLEVTGRIPLGTATNIPGKGTDGMAWVQRR